MFKKIIALFIIFAFQTGIIYAQTCIDGVSPGSASFTHQGGSVDINYELINGCTSIQATTSATWLLVTGSVLKPVGPPPKHIITCFENPSYAGRMATVTFNNNFDVTITQQGKPVPVPTTPTITQNCNNSVLTRGTPPANITWYWQSTANGYSMADDSLTHKVTSTGTYYLRARHSSGSWSAARSVYVEVVTPPLVQVAASPSTTILPGTSVQLTASGATSYQWEPTGTTGSVLNHSPGESTTYTVTGSNSKCSTSKSIFITVQMTATTSQSQNTLNAAVTGGAAPYNYLWSTGETTPAIEADADGTYSVTVTDKYSQGKTSSFNFVKKQEYNKNYVRTFVPMMDHQPTAAPDFNNLDYTKWKVATQYYDGFGRTAQSVISKASPSGNDVVAFADYDDLGRPTKSYLGYTATPGDMPGAYREKVKEEQHAFYETRFGQGDYAFAHVELDGSPLNIPEKQFQHGQEWDGKFSQVITDGSGAFEVIRWKIAGNQLVNDGTYDANKLVKVQVTDEDNRSAIVYKDLQGRGILKKTTAGGNDVLTYTVYDKYGRLRYVLTPKAVPELTAGTYSPDNGLIKELCYYYEYDDRHRLEKKQLPGAGYISMFYDELDRLIETQDAEQRLKGEKSFVEYDAIGRVFASGTEDSQGKQYLSYSYYDNYDGLPAEYAFDASHAWHAKTTKVKGRATWGKTRVMDWEPTSDMPEWLITVTYYDDMGRPIQTVSNNHKKGIDVSSSKYLYDGTVTETQSTHRVAEPTVKAPIVIKDKFEYDERGYLLRQKEQINDEAEVIVNELEYWETGQVKKKKIHSGDNGATFAQIVDFKYNIKGWLTDINEADNLGSDLFGMHLDYTGGGNGEDNDLKNKYLFGGKEQDSKTGFFEYHYRQYDSWLGRWHVVDPMAEEMYGTQSPYHFAGNNPINNMETNGAVWQEAVADGIERDIDEWGNVASGGTGTRTTYRGPTTFFGSGGYYGNYSAGGNYLGSTFTGTFGGSTYTRMNMGRGFPEYTYNGGYYRDGNGNIVDAIFTINLGNFVLILQQT
jgi:RHS repeat-associated protein